MTHRKLQHVYVEIRAPAYSDMVSFPNLLHRSPATEFEVSFGSEDSLNSFGLHIKLKAVVQLAVSATSKNGDDFVIK